MDIRIPGILRDNDLTYLNFLNKSIKDIDPNCEITVRDSIDGLMINILSKIPQLKDQIVRTIRKVHYSLNINVEFSKSLLISKYITFKVKI